MGTAAALGSRLFSRRSGQEDPAGLRKMIGTIAGIPEEFTSNNVELVSGAAVFPDASDPLSGVNPAWCISYFNNVVARGWTPDSSPAVIKSVEKDITYNKVAVDRLDPDFEADFYGSHYPGPTCH